MSSKNYEDVVKSCYTTWSETYFDEYYGANAAYPPVHRDLLKRLLLEAKVKSLLDAGCGPASFLRELTSEGIELHGFDLTPDMVVEARRVLGAFGIPSDHVWEGSVLDPASFKPTGARKAKLFDAAICVGVFPHIPEDTDTAAIKNLRDAVKKGGLVVVEARNQLFSLFTLNRYSYQFFIDELVRAKSLQKRAGSQAAKLALSLHSLQQQFLMDQPPVRKGKEGDPGYDEVLSRTHNPLVLRQQFADAGFKEVRLWFYHYHCLPPMLQRYVPELFRAESLAMEDPEDWRGHFMASAFLIVGRRS